MQVLHGPQFLNCACCGGRKWHSPRHIFGVMALKESCGATALKGLPLEQRYVLHTRCDAHRCAECAHARTGLSPRQRLYLPVKRVFDVAFSLLGLFLAGPILLFTAIAIKLEDGGPVMYRQMRMGKGGRLFWIYKFRSMCVGAEQMQEQLLAYNEVKGPAFKIVKDPRVTHVGRFLRKYSIDELPQLLNIIKGDMSIVGPRPPLPAEVAEYTAFQIKRLTVKPGLTCYWQTSGCSRSSFDRWMKLDIRYIQKLGPLTDLGIILRTVPVVLLGIRGC